MSDRKRRSKKAYPSPVNTTGKLVTMDEEKAEVLNNFLVSVFTVEWMNPKMGTGGATSFPLQEKIRFGIST